MIDTQVPNLGFHSKQLTQVKLQNCDLLWDLNELSSWVYLLEITLGAEASVVSFQPGRWFGSVGSEDYAIALQDHCFPLVLVALSKLNYLQKRVINVDFVDPACLSDTLKISKCGSIMLLLNQPLLFS